MIHRSLSIEEIDKIKKHIAEGVSDRFIIFTFNIAPEIVHKLRQELIDQHKDDIVAILKEGCQPKTAAAYCGLDRRLVFEYAKRIGWTRKWKKPNTLDCHANSRLKIDIDMIKKLSDAGKNLEEIAVLAGVSRERIRQILKSYFHISRRDHPDAVRQKLIRNLIYVLRRIKIQKDVDSRPYRAQAAMQRRIETAKIKLTAAHQLWKEGKTLAEINAVTGIPILSLNWTIGLLRKHTDWFTIRRVYSHRETIVKRFLANESIESICVDHRAYARILSSDNRTRELFINLVRDTYNARQDNARLDYKRASKLYSSNVLQSDITDYKAGKSITLNALLIKRLKKEGLIKRGWKLYD